MSLAANLAFPAAYKSVEDVADWLELKALAADDRQSSAGDIERQLDKLNSEGREILIANVLTEIDRRVIAAGETAYPFARNNTSIDIRSSPNDYIPYWFCLALSYVKWKLRKNAPVNPWLLFEKLCAHCAANYVGGSFVVFGTSSRKGRGAKGVFVRSVDELTQSLREGEKFRPQKTFSTKDGSVDLVAWKAFEDARSSQMILFGQCAGGENWTGAKLRELDPEGFWDQWMNKGKVSALIRSVFIPHRIFDEEEWELRARRARLLFDRCRVVNHAHASAMKDDKLRAAMLECCKTEWKILT